MCIFFFFFFFLMIRRPPRSTLFPYTTALPIYWLVLVVATQEPAQSFQDLGRIVLMDDHPHDLPERGVAIGPPSVVAWRHCPWTTVLCHRSPKLRPETREPIHLFDEQVGRAGNALRHQVRWLDRQHCGSIANHDPVDQRRTVQVAHFASQRSQIAWAAEHGHQAGGRPAKSGIACGYRLQPFLNQPKNHLLGNRWTVSLNERLQAIEQESDQVKTLAGSHALERFRDPDDAFRPPRQFQPGTAQKLPRLVDFLLESGEFLSGRLL